MGVLFCTIVKLFSWSVPRLMFFSSSFKSSSCRQPVAAVKFCFVGVRSTQSELPSTVVLRLGNVSFELYFC